MKKFTTILSAMTNSCQKFFVAAIMIATSLTLTSCNDLMMGLAQGMMGMPMMGFASTDWGSGYAGPTYSSSPGLNTAVAIAQSDARLMSQGVTVNYSTSSSSSSSSSRRTSSSTDNGWYECSCSSTPTFGNIIYHKCPNCGESHQMGSTHMHKKR